MVFLLITAFALLFALGGWRGGVAQGLEQKLVWIAWAYVAIGPMMTIDALRNTGKPVMTTDNGILRVRGFRTQRSFTNRSGLEMNVVLISRHWAYLSIQDNHERSIYLLISRSQMVKGDLTTLQSDLSRWYRGCQP